MSRYHSPFCTAGPQSASRLPRELSEPPPRPPPDSWLVSMKTTTLAAMIAYVTRGSLPIMNAGAETRVRWPAHSGQRTPTGVCRMQSGQIGRPQLEQVTAVSRSGCR